MTLPYGTSTEVELEKEGKNLLGGKKFKDHRGLMKIFWEFNREGKESGGEGVRFDVMNF